MPKLFINSFKEHPATALLEDVAAGDSSIELELGEQDAALVNNLVACESYLISKALAAVFMAGVRAEQRDVRRVSAA